MIAVSRARTLSQGHFRHPLCRWDLDDTGAVGVSDLLVLLANWGPCPWHRGQLAHAQRCENADIGQPTLISHKRRLDTVRLSYTVHVRLHGAL